MDKHLILMATRHQMYNFLLQFSDNHQFVYLIQDDEVFEEMFLSDRCVDLMFYQIKFLKKIKATSNTLQHS